MAKVIYLEKDGLKFDQYVEKYKLEKEKSKFQQSVFELDPKN